MQGSVVKGLLIGGSLGALAGLALARSRATRPSEAGETSNLTDLSSYPNICKDGALMASLQAPIEVFRSLDANCCAMLLQAFDDLVRIYGLCRHGQSKPSLLSDALQARRASSNHLLALMRKVRQRRPMLVGDVEDDVEALRRSLTDYLYNIDQEQQLQQASNVG